MKTITTVQELREVAKQDNRAVVILQLNKSVVDFLMSIYGKNRDLVFTNIQSWISCIKNGEWSVDNCEMKVNSSLSWLIEGHHRTAAVDAEKAYGLCCKMMVIPDDCAETVFKNQDCRGARRNLGVQATLCGIKNAALWSAVEKAHRSYLLADRTPSSVDSIERFMKEHSSVLDRIDTRTKLSGDTHAAPALALACLVRVAEMFPDRIDVINSFWNRVITGEMISKRMPEYHLRARYINSCGIGKKDLVFYTIKALSFAIDGLELGVLKLVDSDYSSLAKRFNISSNRNKLDSQVSISDAKKVVKSVIGKTNKQTK